MSFTTTTNQTPATGSAAMYLFVFNLMTAGWVVKSSSDGTVYNPGGMQITAGSSGVSGFANSKAWVRIQSPAVAGQTREFTIQRGTSNNTDWRIAYSPSVGFTGGAPGATVVPSATDGVIIYGSGTDAAPAFVTIFNTDGSYRFNTVAGNTSFSYSFWMLCTLSTTGVTYTGFAMEVMLIGSGPASDLDPCVIYAGTPANSTIFGADMTNAKGFLGNLTGANFVTIPAMTSSVFPTNMGGQNAWSGKDDAVNILWARGAAPYGAKGYGALLLWNGPAHSNMDTVSINVSRDYLYVNGCLLPWDNSVPLL